MGIQPFNNLKMFHTLKLRMKSQLSDFVGYKLFYSSILGKMFPNDCKVFYELITHLEPINFNNDIVKFNTMILATCMIQPLQFERSNIVAGLAFAA